MSRVLRHKQTVKFDTSNETHLRVYAVFLITGKWNAEIKFMLEEPHDVVPVMIERKLAVQFLKDKGLIKENEKPVI